MVGGFKHVLFLHILGIIIPTDELIFFRGVGQPPTIYIYIIMDSTVVEAIVSGQISLKPTLNDLEKSGGGDRKDLILFYPLVI